MGFLGLFGKKGDLSKHLARVTKKTAQAADRWQSLQTLANAGTEEAIEGLLMRFTIRVDPSITDQEEKELALQGIVGAGEVAVGPTRRFLKSTETIAWPVRILETLEGEGAVVDALLELLETMDTEYARDPQKKIDVLGQLEARPDPRTLPAAQPFLGDVNESVRFHAVTAIGVQENVAEAQEALEAGWAEEDSVRVMSAIADLFIAQGWKLASPERVAGKIPEGYSLAGDTVSKP